MRLNKSEGPFPLETMQIWSLNSTANWVPGDSIPLHTDLKVPVVQTRQLFASYGQDVCKECLKRYAVVFVEIHPEQR